jgi:hypothetical protein
MEVKFSDGNSKDAPIYKERILLSKIRWTMKDLGIAEVCACNSSKTPV